MHALPSLSVSTLKPLNFLYIIYIILFLLFIFSCSQLSLFSLLSTLSYLILSYVILPLSFSHFSHFNHFITFFSQLRKVKNDDLFSKKQGYRCACMGGAGMWRCYAAIMMIFQEDSRQQATPFSMATGGWLSCWSDGDMQASF